MLNDRSQRTRKKKRRYDDNSFEGYGEGYEDDDGGEDGGGGDGEVRKKKKKKKVCHVIPVFSIYREQAAYVNRKLGNVLTWAWL